MLHLRQTTRSTRLLTTITSNTNVIHHHLEKSSHSSLEPNVLLEAKRIHENDSKKFDMNSSKQEVLPSSGFSAFLRSITSGLPFFPSTKSLPTVIDFATTRESYIPLTRPSLIRLLATQTDLLDDDHDHRQFHQLCYGFDSAVSQRYRSILNELKHLFDPLNPDNET